MNPTLLLSCQSCEISEPVIILRGGGARHACGRRPRVDVVQAHIVLHAPNERRAHRRLPWLAGATVGAAWRLQVSCGRRKPALGIRGRRSENPRIRPGARGEISAPKSDRKTQRAKTVGEENRQQRKRPWFMSQKIPLLYNCYTNRIPLVIRKEREGKERDCERALPFAGNTAQRIPSPQST